MRPPANYSCHLQAEDHATTTGQPVKDAIAALELAGSAANAQTNLTQALKHYLAAADFTSRQRDPIEWAGVQWKIASVLGSANRNQEAEAIYRELIPIYEKASGPERRFALYIRHNLSNELRAQGKFAEAGVEYLPVLAAVKGEFPAEHPATLSGRMTLAALLRNGGKNAQAEKEYRDVLSMRRRVLGEDDLYTLDTRNNLAVALDAQGKHAEAEVEYRTVLSIRQRVLGPEHLDFFRSCFDLADCLAVQKKKPEALVLARQALAGLLKTKGEVNEETIDAKKLLAELEKAQ